MKNLCLEWKSNNVFESVTADCNSLRLEARLLNKNTTRGCTNPIINDDKFWFSEIRLSGYYDDHVASGKWCEHLTMLDAQLEAEDLAREYLSKDWYKLNPDLK